MGNKKNGLTENYVKNYVSMRTMFEKFIRMAFTEIPTRNANAHILSGAFFFFVYPFWIDAQLMKIKLIKIRRTVREYS